MTKKQTADVGSTPEPWETENPRTRLDEDFDEVRAILTRNGMTLEIAMQRLYEIRQDNE